MNNKKVYLFALKLALEALEKHAELGLLAGATIASIREALAQPEQEPVAYSYTSRITGAQGFSHHPMPRFIDSESWDIQPLYTSPPASKPWVGLSTDEMKEIANRYHLKPPNVPVAFRAIEVKLREKNTPQQSKGDA